MLTVRRASIEDIEDIVPLFDSYRQFYRQRSDPEGARQFLRERMAREQSIIFLAFEGPRAIGFNQLYPSFSSGALARIFILNDLFVEPDSRRSGAGTELLAQAAKYGRAQGAVRLVLSTEATNTHAQALYERCGWTHDTAFLTYQFRL